jgi:pantoate--beta-alanine ligase
MNIVTKIADWQALRNTFKHQTLGFVPTMGHLHEGHLSLCARSKTENDVTVVSIFVNPTQFNEVRDYELYTRHIEQDVQMLRPLHVDYLLLPEVEEIYPDDYQIQVMETELSLLLEGEYRPGHFSGMLTVVLKLLNLVAPHHAYFGEKDYQQLLLIKKMVKALFLPVKIESCATLRAADGLALSSRNARLSAEQRELAAHFPRFLHSDLSLEVIAEQLKALGFKIDYLAEKWQRRLGAVRLGEVRLIDNISCTDERV